LADPKRILPEPSPYSLPCADGSEFDFDVKFLNAALKAYPLVDLNRQFLKARAWLEANPTRKKTRRGMTKFFNGWLSTAQGDAEKGRAKDAPVTTTGRDITEADCAVAPWARKGAA